MPRKVFPLPEAIDDQFWSVREGAPHINFDKQYLSVPLDDQPQSCFLRAHEQAHLKWTPGKSDEDIAESEGLGWATVQCIEDNRMHALLASVGVDMTSGGMKAPDRLALAESIVKVGNFRNATLCAVASYGTGDYPTLAAAFTGTPMRNALQLAIEVRWRLATGGGGITDFVNGMAVARWLETIIGRDSSHRRGSRFVPGQGDQLHPLLRMYGGPTIETGDFPLRCDEEDGPTERKPNIPVAGFIPWGVMEIDEPNLPLPACSRKSGWRAEDTGSVLRGPHRLLIDGRVFASKRRHKGGSVLVDFSGSMNLKDTEVERILANAPSTVIAVYSGERNSGVLRILARNGRRVTGDLVRRPSGSCNVVDGPALDWLARQPEPRYWLSDGMVTGVGDTAGTGNTDYASLVTSEARIRRVHTTADLFLAIHRATRGSRRAMKSEIR